MESIQLGNSNIVSSRLVYGCMRIFGEGTIEDRQKGKQAIRAAIDTGFNHFDHADIYGAGKCEELFSEVLAENKNLRDKIILTGKCGIRPENYPRQNDPGRYYFSKKYIIKSVEGSLTRLDSEYLDILLLHRPDYLGNPI